jgi:K+/H+ antiporter YhaU regulatory subunit KhtT
MHSVKVREQALPGIGVLVEMTTADGPIVSVVCHRTRRRDVSIRGRHDDTAIASVHLSEDEALALASVLAGLIVERDAGTETETGT